MKHLSILVKPASSLCNMRCHYCFYVDVSSNRTVRSYGIMSEETAESIIDHVLSDLQKGDLLTVAFQGGEPTVAGLPCIRHFVEYLREKAVGIDLEFALQTNGLLLDDTWCAFLKEHDFLVGLSLDGPAQIHNANRVDDKGQGTFYAVMEARRRLKQYGVEHNILCVLTEDTARHPQQLWKFVCEQRLRYIQFIPCLDELEGCGQDWALTPKRFFEFYSALFDLWHKEVGKGRYVSVKLFDDIANLFFRRQVTACGMTGQCSLQYVVEADGSVYPCDFYVMDEYKLGNLTVQTPLELAQHYRSECKNQPEWVLREICASCRYRTMCGGGCKRMRENMYIAGDYCGYRELLNRILVPLCEDAGQIMRHPERFKF